MSARKKYTQKLPAPPMDRAVVKFLRDNYGPEYTIEEIVDGVNQDRMIPLPEHLLKNALVRQIRKGRVQKFESTTPTGLLVEYCLTEDECIHEQL